MAPEKGKNACIMLATLALKISPMTQAVYPLKCSEQSLATYLFTSVISPHKYLSETFFNLNDYIGRVKYVDIMKQVQFKC